MSAGRPRRVGIDFDNTLVDYSAAARILAHQESIADIQTVRDLKEKFRETWGNRWQSLQSVLYTEGLRYARPSDGALAFIEHALDREVEVFVVSHKTTHTPASHGGINLRQPAFAWLRRELIAPKLIPTDRVFFCSTRREKIEKIRNLELDWLIDDLPEVLLDPDFPDSTAGLLFTNEPRTASSAGVRAHETHDLPLVHSFIDLMRLIN